MKFKGKEKTRGITLIALIITIIVMLILAGVSINAIVGDNGIVTKSMESSFKSAMSQYLEESNTYVVTKQVETGDYDSVYYSGDINKNLIYRGIYDQLQTLDKTLTNVDITETTSCDRDDYKSHIGIEANVFTWYTDEKDSNEVQWCLDLGIKVYVEGTGYLDENGNIIYKSQGEYAQHGSVYMNEPDLTGYSTGNTYYVVYNSDNKTTSKIDSESKIYNDVPDGWYDYSDKTTGTSKWANIVTVSNNHMAYWVWIPRYAYKVTNPATATDTADANSLATEIRFVDTDNSWKDSSGEEHKYSEFSATYKVPSAFTFDGKELAGIWVSKYELSDPLEPTGFSVQMDEKSITVSSITWNGESKTLTDTDTKASEDQVAAGKALAEQVEKAEVKITYSGGTKNGTITHTLPYTIEDLDPGTSYEIKVTTPTYGIDPLTLTKTVSTLEGTAEELSAPDMRGFSSSNTYYAYFDSTNVTSDPTTTSAEPVIGEAVTINSSADKWGKYTANNVKTSDWYDYSEKRWANVFTINHDTGEGAFWVWIPRYEYYVDTDMKICDIIFISTSKTEADPGYSIPTAFTSTDSNGKTVQLSGIWVMKYEISDVAIASGFYSTVTSDSIEITNLSYTNGSFTTNTTKSMPNVAYVTCTGGLESDSITITGRDANGDSLENSADQYVIGSVSKKTVKITGLSSGQSYTVTLEVPYIYQDTTAGNTAKKLFTQKITKTITTASDARTPNAPDVTGFTSNSGTYAYYLTYSSTSDDGIIGDRITSTSTAPNGWYDYTNKNWANVLVSDKDLSGYSTVSSIPKTYTTDTNGNIIYDYNVNIFVWIPKYAYSYDTSQRTTTIMMLKSGESAPTGYKVPSAFTFGGKELTGFWCAKYEIGNEVK